jgi:hypothetical protein
MDPAHLARLWVGHQRCLDQSLIEAVARPEHQPVLPERNLTEVAVCRDMPNGKESHEMMLSALPSPNGHSLLTSRKMLGERNPTPLPHETRIVEYLLSRT